MMKNEEIKNEFSVNELKFGGIKVRGKIDRLELNENKKQFNVVDYKLGGNKPSGNDLHEIHNGNGRIVDNGQAAIDGFSQAAYFHHRVRCGFRRRHRPRRDRASGDA